MKKFFISQNIADSHEDSEKKLETLKIGFSGKIGPFESEEAANLFLKNKLEETKTAIKENIKNELDFLKRVKRKLINLEQI